MPRKKSQTATAPQRKAKTSKSQAKVKTAKAKDLRSRAAGIRKRFRKKPPTPKIPKDKSEAADTPRIDVLSLLYVWDIYRKAVGPRRYFSVIYNVYNSVISGITPLIAGLAVDKIIAAISTHDFMPFMIVIIILLLIDLAGVILSEVNSLFTEKNYNDIYTYVRQEVALKYIHVPLRVRETSEFADKFARVREFASSVSAVSQQIIGILSAVVGLITVAAASLTISPFIFIFMFLAAIPYAVMSIRYAMRRRRNYRHFSRDRRIAVEIERKIINSDSALEIELNGLSDYLVGRMISHLRKGQAKDLADHQEFFWPNIATRIIEDISNYAVLIAVAIAIIIGRLTVGNFLSVRNLLQELRNGIISLFDNIVDASSGLVNATDYMEFVDAKESESGDIIIDKIPTIEFRDVCFSYPKSDRMALKNVSFVLNPGDNLAIVGANGAGKTTLIKLMIGAYRPSSGQILINGEPIEKVDRDSYLLQIGALFQSYSRYEFASLGENVWLGDINSPYDEKAIRRALRMVGLDDLPERYGGLDQIMAKDFDPYRPTDISGGQWQRLCIARAFFRAPNVLILDEPTSAVDAQSEYEIFKNILKNQRKKTTLIISHRFSTVRKAERIIVLDNGEIKEQGTHNELIKQNGIYKEMFTMQAEGYN